MTSLSLLETSATETRPDLVAIRFEDYSVS